MDSRIYIYLLTLSKKLCFIAMMSLFFINDIMACPNCAASANSGSGKNYLVMILGIFVLLTYVPMYFFYRWIKKHNTPSNNQAVKPE